MRKQTIALRLATALLLVSSAALAQDVSETPIAPSTETEKPTPYDDRLARLSEIIGAVHYLRNLCKADGEPEWRQSLQQLLDAETQTEPKRRARMTAAYNRGYRSFASVYTSCTPAAVRAEQNYRNEGATLATEITARFGN
jgi:uncharacterized protein (TIGR02301 family)